SGGGGGGSCEGSRAKEDDDSREPFRPPGFIPECLKTRAVPPLGEVWPEVMHHDRCYDYDSETIRESCHASAEEMNLFETTGWKNGELDPVIAVALMTAVVYTMGQMFPGGEHGGGWDGTHSHETRHTDKKWEDVHFVGLKTNPLHALCRHYGARPKTLQGVTTSAAYKMYTQTGWHGDELTPGVVDFLNQRTAVILLSGRDYRPPSDEVPGSNHCPPATEVPGSDYHPPADEAEVPVSDYPPAGGGSEDPPPRGELPGSDHRPRAGEVPGNDYHPSVSEVGVPERDYSRPAGEVEVPESDCLPPADERNDERPPAGEVPGSDYRCPVAEIEVPGSACPSPAGAMPGSDCRPPADEAPVRDDRTLADGVPGTDYAPPAGKVPRSDYRPPAGEGSDAPPLFGEVPGSDYHPSVGEVEVPGRDYRPPPGEVEVPGSGYLTPAGEVEVLGSDCRTPADEVEIVSIDSSDDDNIGSKKRKIKTEPCSRNSVQKIGEGSLTSRRSSILSASSAARQLKEESRDEREDSQRRFEAQQAARMAEREDDRAEREAARKERLEIARATFAENKRKDKIAAAERLREDEIAVERERRLHEIKMLQLQLDLANAKAGRASWNRQEEEHGREKRMPAKVVLLGCAQDAGVPQVGCACQRCDSARSNPADKDCMVACLGIVDESEGKVFLVDATPDLGAQLWSIQHAEQKDIDAQPLELGGILLTHAHTGHYTGLLQLGKEGADARNVPVFCTPKMGYFLRNNEPWAQLTERGNISIRELQTTDTSSGGAGSGDGLASVRLTPSVSFLPVLVPHRAEMSDTVAYVISIIGGDAAAKKVMYCPHTDGWAGWTRSIRDWCKEVDVALLDATFYGRAELRDRDMSEVSHPLAQDTMKELAGCKAEVVLVHLNHTNPLFVVDSPERTQAETAGFKVSFT
ncbi:unnamed protein product, partial [Laminaria digitata]